jgi:hypothetical protein
MFTALWIQAAAQPQNADDGQRWDATVLLLRS